MVMLWCCYSFRLGCVELLSVFNVVGFPTKEIHIVYGIYQNWAAVQQLKQGLPIKFK